MCWVDRNQMGTFLNAVWWESWHFLGLTKQINTPHARRKSMRKSCSNWRWWMSFPQEVETQLMVLSREQVGWLTPGMAALVFGYSMGWPAEPTEEKPFGCGPKSEAIFPLTQSYTAVGVGQCGETRCWGLFVSAASVPTLWLSRGKLATEQLGCKHVCKSNIPIFKVLSLQAVCYWARYLPPLNSFFLSIKHR